MAQPPTVRVFKRTQDCWYPSFRLEGFYEGKKNIELVEVSFLRLHSGEWRVCVWGADDCGMELDFTKNERSAAQDIFLKVLSFDQVSVHDLEKLGFVRT